MMRTRFAADEAQCQDCRHLFVHPEPGDMSYGEFIFSTTDGERFAYCNAFEPGPQLIHELMGDATPDCFQSALAHFADPLDNSPLTNETRCPKCGSTSLRRFTGKSCDPVTLPIVQFSIVLALERSDLAEQLSKFRANWPA